MAGRKSDFTLPTLDDLFSTQELRDDAKLSKIRDIPLELIDDFPDHPFKVRDDEDMIQLVESVKERGVITPAICGKFFITYAPFDAERFQSLPPDLAEKYREKFKYPERFMRVNNEIVAVPFKPVRADKER